MGDAAGSQVARVLVAGIGNIFLSDDGFGCEVARRLMAKALPEGVTVRDFGIRGMHLAYELLDGYAGLVIVDAVPGHGDAGDLTLLAIGEDDIGSGDFDAHGMEPTAVLASLGSLGGHLPPTFLVGCQPVTVDDGIGLSPAVERAVDHAIEMVLDVLRSRLMLSGTAARGVAS